MHRCSLPLRHRRLEVMIMIGQLYAVKRIGVNPSVSSRMGMEAAMIAAGGTPKHKAHGQSFPSFFQS